MCLAEETRKGVCAMSEQVRKIKEKTKKNRKPPHVQDKRT